MLFPKRPLVSGGVTAKEVARQSRVRWKFNFNAFEVLRNGRAWHLAAVLVLKSNPLDDIGHAADIDSVIKNGVVHSADSLLH
jgi:hypothetical protein